LITYNDILVKAFDNVIYIRYSVNDSNKAK